MKEKKLLGIHIADKPIRIKSDNADNLSYIKSILKSYLKPVGEPYFSVHVNTSLPKKDFVEEPHVRIDRQKDRFVFVNINGRKSNQELGFIDKQKRVCQLNTNPQTARRLFHPFLASTCALFLSEEGAFIIHAVGFIYKGEAYIFVGPSGSGKSTIASILKKKGLNIISDERIIIRKRGSSFTAFAFPWYNYKSQCAPLKNIFFLKKSNAVGFNRLNPSYAIMKLFSNTTLNLPDREVAKRVLNILAFLSKKIPAYEMQFRKDDSFWQKLKDLN